MNTPQAAEQATAEEPMQEQPAQQAVVTRTEQIEMPLREIKREDAPQSHVCQCGGGCKVEAVDAGVAAPERVLAALERAGCEGCAAKMVLKRELKAMRANKEVSRG